MKCLSIGNIPCNEIENDIAAVDDGSTVISLLHKKIHLVKKKICSARDVNQKICGT